MLPRVRWIRPGLMYTCYLKGLWMTEAKQQHEPGWLLEMVQKQHRRSMWNIRLWVVLALPVTWTFSYLVCSEGNPHLYSIEDRFHYFLIAMLVWTVSHIAFVVLLSLFVKLEAGAILAKMKQLQFCPSGQEVPISINYQEHGVLVTQQFETDRCSRFPPLEPVLSAISEYYEACVNDKLLPYTKWMTILEGSIVIGGISLVILIGLPLAIYSRISYVPGFNAFQLVFIQCCGFAIYGLYAWTITRKLAMLKALETSLGEP